MKYYTIPPPSALQAYVRFFWVLEGSATPDTPFIHRSMADGCCEMIFHYTGCFEELLPGGGSTSSGLSGISGPSSTFSRFRIHEGFGIFGAYLYPYAISALLQIPATAVTNQLPDLATLLGQTGKDLEEQIMLAPDNISRTRILSKFLESRITGRHTRQPPVFDIIHRIIRSKGTVTVADLASQCYLSARQFERHFKTHTGFSPKLYTRIIRFQAAMNEYNQKDMSLTGIAHQCGYYDQAHFIHDFREFSGYNPRQFFSGGAEGASWREQ